MGSLTGPGISSKALVLLDPAILISLEKDDKYLAILNTVQLIKHLGYVTDIFISIYNLKKISIVGIRNCAICILMSFMVDNYDIHIYYFVQFAYIFLSKYIKRKIKNIIKCNRKCVSMMQHVIEHKLYCEILSNKG
jgi:hypothetical protein